MSASDWVIIIGALGAMFVAIIGAIGTVLLQVQSTHRLVDGQTHALLAITQRASFAEGKLEGQNGDTVTGTGPAHA